MEAIKIVIPKSEHKKTEARSACLRRQTLFLLSDVAGTPWTKRRTVCILGVTCTGWLDFYGRSHTVIPGLVKLATIDYTFDTVDWTLPLDQSRFCLPF